MRWASGLDALPRLSWMPNPADCCKQGQATYCNSNVVMVSSFTLLTALCSTTHLRRGRRQEPREEACRIDNP